VWLGLREMLAQVFRIETAEVQLTLPASRVGFHFERTVPRRVKQT